MAEQTEKLEAIRRDNEGKSLGEMGILWLIMSSCDMPYTCDTKKSTKFH